MTVMQNLTYKSFNKNIQNILAQYKIDDYQSLKLSIETFITNKCCNHKGILEDFKEEKKFKKIILICFKALTLYRNNEEAIININFLFIKFINKSKYKNKIEALQLIRRIFHYILLKFKII